MLEAARIYSFKRDNLTYSLYVDSIRSKSEYWLEIKDGNGNIEMSEKFYSWNDAVNLLEEYDWANYEVDKIDLTFADMIGEARRRSLAQRRRPYNAQQRLLEILKRLESNETLVMENATEEFGVGRDQIQRDIRTINEFLAHSNKNVEYIRAKKGYELNVRGDYFTLDDALIVLLLLYGTRALNKEELKQFSNKMISLFSQVEQIKLREFFQSYLYHYQPVQEQSLFELFYKCFQAISEKRTLKFTYTNNKGETSIKEVIPYTITYHDSKFYLFARLKGTVDESPRAFQMDRIQDCGITNQSFRLESSDIKIGEYVRRSFNMYVGDLQEVRLKVKDSNIPYLKRRFPKVSISPSIDNQWFDVELEVYGLQGIKLWILQQGQFVKVVAPLELREKVKQDISEMYQMYFESSRV
ncbi:WYL domain-containing protein [Neobacillus drentensis]|uniref:helix-turn-helix transcriptional regulator n=1 Tax=Neobacillus drentensis TaxID=220684 RepID=UPI003002210C